MVVDPEKFLSFELEQSLFELEVDNIPIWERIRFQVFREIREQNGEGQAHSKVQKSSKDYVKGGWLFLKNLIQKNPYFAEETDLLFVGHPRRKLEADGYWWDVYTDPIHCEYEYDYIHLERPYRLNHLKPARTEKIRYLDVVQYAGTIQRLLGLNRPEISEDVIEVLESIQAAISNEFGAEIDIVQLVIENLHERGTVIDLYRRLLRRLNPEIVILVVSYGQETLIEACKQMGIPTVELQHGVIYEHHLGYSYSGNRTKASFPDYLLVWGQYWKDQVEYPLPADRVVPVGFPYLERMSQEFEEIDAKQQLIFISQGTIGKRLSRFAIEVNQHPGIDLDIVYKLHPGEYDFWKDEYPWLKDADFEVVADSDKSLYKLLAESSVQVGVSSTALYEGLYFGLDTFLLDAPGVKSMGGLINKGSAAVVKDATELAVSLRTSELKTECLTEIFEPESLENTVETICALADRSLDH